MFDDNIYWLLGEEIVDSYSVDWALKYRTSSQIEKLNNLVMKVWRQHDEIIGFIGYYLYVPVHWVVVLVVDKKISQTRIR